MDYGIDRLINNLLTSSITAPKQVENNLADTTQDIIKRNSDTLSISAMGQHINELYSELQLEGSEEAQTGFRELMTDLAADPNSMDTFSFVDTATRLSDEDTEVFNETFEVVNTLEEADISSRSWFRTLDNIETGQVENYLEITDKIVSIEDQEMRDGLLTQMMTAINEITSSEDLSEEEIDALMEQFLFELSEMDSVSNLEEYMTNFLEDLL